MKQLTCPMSGTRDITEFRYLGPRRATSAEDGRTVVRHTLYPKNPVEPMVEWFCHRLSNTILLAERHTVTDIVIRTWLPSATEGSDG